MVVEYFDGSSLLAVLVPRIDAPVISDETQFLTSDDAVFQIGVITRMAHSEIVPHVHFPVKRIIEGTPEALLIVSGRVSVDLYSSNKDFVQSFTAATGDLIVFVSGGHGFRFDEHTRLIEIKQGPYVRSGDKEKFLAGEANS